MLQITRLTVQSLELLHNQYKLGFTQSPELAGVLLTSGSGDFLYPKEDDMPAGLLDHEILVEEGFYDMQRYPERIPAGKKLRVTKEQYVLMKGSDPNSIQLLSVGPDPDTLARIIADAKAEKTEEKEVVVQGSNLVEEADWQPVGWYKAQLMKDKDLVLDE